MPVVSNVGKSVNFGAPKDVRTKGGKASKGKIVDEVWADPDVFDRPTHGECARAPECWGDYAFCGQLIEWEGTADAPAVRHVRLAYYRRRCGEDHWEFASQMGHETKNILALMKLTGAGPAEIGGLLLGDLLLDHAVPHIVIRANAARGLKRESRERRVPLLGAALDAAADAVKRAGVHAKGKGNVPVFEGFGANGRGADSISAKLNKAIRSAGIADRKLTAYSYRHAMAEAMRAAGIMDHVSRAILGHAAKDSHERYGAKARPLAELQAAMQKAIERLGDEEEETK